MSDEEDYLGKELMQSAKAKLTPEEMKTVITWAYNTTLGKVNDWILKDMDNIDHLNRREEIIYLRVIWLLINESKVPNHVDEDESKKIKTMRKIGFSIAELSRMFQRSKSTIHSHIEGSITDQEEREIRIDSYDSTR